MELKYFTATNGKRIAIPAEKITGFTESDAHGNTFISTGSDGADGGENGWYVVEKFEVVMSILQSMSKVTGKRLENK